MTSMKNSKCKLCGTELVFITKKTYEKIVDEIKPSFKSISKEKDGIFSLCPQCDSYALGAELEAGYPLFDCDGIKNRIENLHSSDEHKLKDMLRDGLDIVFCGTAAGNKSAESNSYYAGSSNSFWKVLMQVGLTKEEIMPENYAELLEYNIGFTDINKSESGMDKDVDLGDDTDIAILKYKILKYAPKILAFTSKEAAKMFFQSKNLQYGLQTLEIGRTKLYICPSTSGAARRYFDIKYWSELNDLV